MPRIMFPLLMAVCTTLLSFSAPNANAAEPQRRALLIGINDYLSPKVPDLRGAVNDVEMLKRILVTRLGFPEQNIKLLTDAAATRSAVLDAIDELVTSAGKDDVIYFHYSGHGSRARDRNGDETDGFDETILPQDARTEGIPDILDDEFEALFAKLKSEHALIVFDSCHSGTITRSVSAVRPRSVPADTRDELYAGAISTRAVVEVNMLNHVLMTGAPPEEEALDGPIDEGFYGLFSYSLAQALDQAGPEGTPEQIHRGIKQELQRIHEQLYFSPPEPQLEVAAERLNQPLMPAPRADAGSAPAEQTAPEQTARRAWLPVEALEGDRYRLIDGVSLNARPGSRWGIYGVGESRFLPGKAVAFGSVVELSGRDAVLRVSDRGVEIPHGARAIEFAPPDVSTDMPVQLSGVKAGRKKVLASLLKERLPGLRFVGEGEFARIIVRLVGRQWQLFDASGLQKKQVFDDAANDKVAQRLLQILERSSNSLALLALDNPASDIQLDIGVKTENDTGSRGLVKVKENARPGYRVRRSGEPRGHANSLMIEVVADRPVYLTIVDVDTEGTVTQLFPNSYQRPDFFADGFLPANSIALIPDSLKSGNRAGFHWDYSPPAGRDTLRVFASEDLQTAQLIRRFIAGGNGGSQGFAQLGDELAEINTRGIKVVADSDDDSDAEDAVASVAPTSEGFKQTNWTARSLVLEIRD